jgi:hypothetical protein
VEDGGRSAPGSRPEPTGQSVLHVPPERFVSAHVSRRYACADEQTPWPELRTLAVECAARANNSSRTRGKSTQLVPGHGRKADGSLYVFCGPKGNAFNGEIAWAQIEHVRMTISTDRARIAKSGEPRVREAGQGVPVDGASGGEPRPALRCAMPRSRRAWGALRTPPFVKPFDSTGSSQMPVGCCMTRPANVRTDCGGFVNRAERSRVAIGCNSLRSVATRVR